MITKLNQEQIKEIIPHRDPFLLLDEITMLNMETNEVQGLKHFTGNEDFFKGHFPQFPVVPGVLILEALAQNGAVCLLSMPEFKGKIGFFARANNVKWKKMVVPGDTLILKTKMTKMKAGVAFCDAEAFVGDELACSAEIVCAVK